MLAYGLVVLIALAGPAALARERAAGAATIAEIAVPQLPAEARATLVLIRKGGPYPHRQDNTTFGNRERLLPPQSRGYYREYTVATPGARDRGARRIIAAGNPPQEFFYTDDHYQSFRRIQE